MASKFQNRLVGTVILVALGVIILPGLLDGKKKHYEDEFAAIPLVPKAGDVEENDVLPPVTQPLPAQPPEGAGALVEQQAANEAAAQQAARQTAQQPTQVAPPPVETRPQPVPQPKPKPVETKPVEVKPKPTPQPKPVEVKPAPKPEPKPEPTPKPEPAPQPKPAEEKAPAGQAYVVQLGALKTPPRRTRLSPRCASRAIAPLPCRQRRCRGRSPASTSARTLPSRSCRRRCRR